MSHFELDIQERTDFHASDDATASEAVNVCFNCHSTCDTLHYVPEFDYMGCTRCLDEAMEILAAEAAAIPARIEPMQGSLFAKQEVA